MNGTVLIIDDEELLCRELARWLRHEGWQASTALDAASGRASLRETEPDVVLLDLHLPDADGNDLLAELKPAHPRVQFIVITAHGSIRTAIESTRRGACDFLTKPFEPDEMLFAIRSALRRQAVGEEVRRLRAGHAVAGDRGQAVGESLSYPSAAMRRLRELLERAAAQDGIVLFLGESGSGKDRLARWVHDHSRRADGPFFAVNCAAVSRELAESELFGHEPGAFTGTRGRKRGLLELADGGTLLLNEVGELDLAVQAKLLSFLDGRSFVRVGGEKSVRIDARIFAATNRDLAGEVERGTFRRDLFYRINVVPIAVPPLRERREDLPILVDELLLRLAAGMALPARPTITPDALALLGAHDWPGNVRELRNVLERALMVSSDGGISRASLGLSVAPSGWSLEVPFPNGSSLHEVLDGVARKLVKEALRRARGKQDAAQLLGVTRHVLAHQMKKLGIDA